MRFRGLIRGLKARNVNGHQTHHDKIDSHKTHFVPERSMARSFIFTGLALIYITVNAVGKKMRLKGNLWLKTIITH